MIISEALEVFSSQITPITDDPFLEARLIIQKATGLSRPVLLSHPEKELSESEQMEITKMTARRATGFPLPYILGEWEFYGRSFFVDPSVLIPRPETELLAEEALGWLRHHPQTDLAFDVGTGSGCIAATLLCEAKNLHVAAVDIKRDALETASKNAVRHKVRDRFHPIQADLFSAFDTKAGLICANLPYIQSESCKTIEPARFEPLSALDGGADGFELYRLLFQQIANKIREESLVLCEIEYRQRETALQTAAVFFPHAEISVMNDLARQPRLLKIKSETKRT